jgi:hypothetical protein
MSSSEAVARSSARIKGWFTKADASAKDSSNDGSSVEEKQARETAVRANRTNRDGRGTSFDEHKRGRLDSSGSYQDFDDDDDNEDDDDPSKAGGKETTEFCELKLIGESAVRSDFIMYGVDSSKQMDSQRWMELLSHSVAHSQVPSAGAAGEEGAEIEKPKHHVRLSSATFNKGVLSLGKKFNNLLHGAQHPEDEHAGEDKRGGMAVSKGDLDVGQGHAHSSSLARPMSMDNRTSSSLPGSFPSSWAGKSARPASNNHSDVSSGLSITSPLAGGGGSKASVSAFWESGSEGASMSSFDTDFSDKGPSDSNFVDLRVSLSALDPPKKAVGFFVVLFLQVNGSSEGADDDFDGKLSHATSAHPVRPKSTLGRFSTAPSSGYTNDPGQISHNRGRSMHPDGGGGDDGAEAKAKNLNHQARWTPVMRTETQEILWLSDRESSATQNEGEDGAVHLRKSHSTLHRGEKKEGGSASVAPFSVLLKAPWAYTACLRVYAAHDFEREELSAHHFYGEVKVQPEVNFFSRSSSTHTLRTGTGKLAVHKYTPNVSPSPNNIVQGYVFDGTAGPVHVEEELRIWPMLFTVPTLFLELRLHELGAELEILNHKITKKVKRVELMEKQLLLDGDDGPGGGGTAAAAETGTEDDGKIDRRRSLSDLTRKSLRTALPAHASMKLTAHAVEQALGGGGGAGESSPSSGFPLASGGELSPSGSATAGSLDGDDASTAVAQRVKDYRLDVKNLSLRAERLQSVIKDYHKFHETYEGMDRCKNKRPHFKTSAMKGLPAWAFVATNLTIHRLKILREGGEDEDPSTKAKLVYGCVSHGCPAAHHFKFKQGGLKSIVGKCQSKGGGSAEQQHLQQHASTPTVPTSEDAQRGAPFGSSEWTSEMSLSESRDSLLSVSDSGDTLLHSLPTATALASSQATSGGATTPTAAATPTSSSEMRKDKDPVMAATAKQMESEILVMRRKDCVMSQALSILASSFTVTLQQCIATKDVRQLLQLVEVGFLMQGESLLSVAGTHRKGGCKYLGKHLGEGVPNVEVGEEKEGERRERRERRRRRRRCAEWRGGGGGGGEEE